MKTLLHISAACLLAAFGGEALGAATAAIFPGTTGTILACVMILLLVATIAWRTVRRMRQPGVTVMGMDPAATESVSCQLVATMTTDGKVIDVEYIETTRTRKPHTPYP